MSRPGYVKVMLPDWFPRIPPELLGPPPPAPVPITDVDPPDGDLECLISPYLGRDLSISCIIHMPRVFYDNLPLVNKCFRTFVRSGELYRARRIAGIAEPWIYLSCKKNRFESFDPVSRKWIKLPYMPIEPIFMHSDKESLAVGTELLVIGREEGEISIFKFSLVTNEWTTENPPMNVKRCLFASAAVGSIAYVAGGSLMSGEIQGSAEVYDSEKGTWSWLPGGLKTPRKMTAGVMMDGKFYVIGGVDTDKNPVTSGEAYDPRTRTWEEIPNMCPAKLWSGGCPPLCAVAKNVLYAAEVGEMDLWKYLKEKNKWIVIGKLPKRIVCTKGWGVAFRAVGDMLVFIGGPKGGTGVVEINGWVPPSPPPANGGGGRGRGRGGRGRGRGGVVAPLHPGPQWKVIAQRNINGSTYVYNCAIMSC